MNAERGPPVALEMSIERRSPGIFGYGDVRVWTDYRGIEFLFSDVSAASLMFCEMYERLSEFYSYNIAGYPTRATVISTAIRRRDSNPQTQSSPSARQ